MSVGREQAVGALGASLPKACVIGAGCSGFTTIKALVDRGIPFDCFEMSDQIGGNWVYDNPNGRSSAYRSLHIDTSKERMQFADLPIPRDFPDYPHHSQVLAYFNAYVDHFDLRRRITFKTEVTHCARRPEGGWDVTLSTGETRAYDALFVCNGHHWNPRWPDPPFPGRFDGAQFHSHSYRDPFDPVDLRGRNVVVVGMGNSAMDIASELGQKPIANKLFLSARRGVYIFPKYMFGRVADKGRSNPLLPDSWQRWLAGAMLRLTVGRMEDYGLPKPDHKPLEAHPSVSGEILTRLGCGDVIVKPNIAELMGDKVRFVDGSVEPVDAIIYATGYNVSFPFLDDDVAPVRDNHIALFKRVIRPGIPDLFFMGLAQPLPTLVNFAEIQAKWISAYLSGDYALPDQATMERVIAEDERRFLGHFYASPRHTMQLNYDVYAADIARERKRGAARAKALGLGPHHLPVPARAQRDQPARAAE